MPDFDELVRRLDELTAYQHDLAAFADAWIVTWLAMEEWATTDEARAWCRYEVECWSKVRLHSVQAVGGDINALLRRPNG